MGVSQNYLVGNRELITSVTWSTFLQWLAQWAFLNHFPGQPCQPAPSSETPRRCHHAPSTASNAQFLTWIPFFTAMLGCPNCHIAFLHLVCQEDQQPNKDQQWHAPRDEELPKPTKCRLSAFMAFAVTKWQVKDLKRIWKTAATGPRNVK